jgi:hypothetical protein
VGREVLLSRESEGADDVNRGSVRGSNMSGFELT